MLTHLPRAIAAKGDYESDSPAFIALTMIQLDARMATHDLVLKLLAWSERSKMLAVRDDEAAEAQEIVRDLEKLFTTINNLLD